MRFAVVLALLLTSCTRTADDTSRPASTSPTASASTSGETRLRLIDAGREPRVKIGFALASGRTEAAVLDIESRVAQGSETLQEEHATFRLRVRYPAADVLELTVLRAETTATDIPRVTTAAGVRLTMKILASGMVTDVPDIVIPPSADPRAGDYARGALAQVASCLLPVVPAEPIGDGARWAIDHGGYALVAPPVPILMVERSAGIHGPTKMDTGETIHVDEEQTHRIEAPRDGVARHVDARLIAAQQDGKIRTTRMRFDIEVP